MRSFIVFLCLLGHTVAAPAIEQKVVTRYALDAHTKVSQRALKSAKQNLRHGLLLRKHLESAGFFAEGSGDTVDFTGVLYKRDTIDDGSTAPCAMGVGLSADDSRSGPRVAEIF